MPLVLFAGSAIRSQSRIDVFKPASQVELNALVATYGFPLYGLFIASDSIEIPDFIKHVTTFPPQTGAPAQRADKLQLALDAEVQGAYANLAYTKGRPFFTNTHVWTYKDNSALYVPRENGSGDFALYVSDSQPPGNWWANL